MVPQLQRVAFPFSIPVYSTGGFSSVTVTWEIAKRALLRRVPTVFLHCGDFDPSGESIFEAMAQDARMFVGQVEYAAKQGDEIANAVGLGAAMGLEREQVMEIVHGDRSPELRPRRVALTEDQVFEHDLPTAPPKKSDTRSRNWVGETCQLEAMPPELLASTVRDAILGEIDVELYEEEREREAADRDRIQAGIELAMEA